MIREIDIWRVALLMVNRYADAAEAKADRCADEAETEGDHGGCGDLASSHSCDRAFNRHDGTTALILIGSLPRIICDTSRTQSRPPEEIRISG